MGCARGCCPSPADHYRSVRFGGTPAASRTEQKERALAKDLAAYKELRRQGTQPPKIDGAHRLAQRAETRAEVETGTVLDAKQRAQYTALSKDMA